MLLHPSYTLKDNFIIQNAYMCIEPNAHALLTYLLSARNQLKEQETCFLPWLLGSQSCEKIFRLARSMTSTFSTIINFGMLGLLRRLHCLEIQATLQAETNKTGIVYPQLEKHKAKEGKNVYLIQSLHEITDVDIAEAIMKAEIRAKGSIIEELGLADYSRSTRSGTGLVMVGKWLLMMILMTAKMMMHDDCTATDEFIITTLVPEVCVEGPLMKILATPLIKLDA